MFFDDHPAFLSTSVTATELDRLNLRHEAIIADNADVLRGARVLDIASHDGRWSFAALKAGAAHVTGVEAREHLVVNARKTLAAEGIAATSYEMVHGEAFDVLSRGGMQVDVVLCLGFVYHTLRYPELFSGIRATGARHVIVDTDVTPARQAVIRLRTENTDDAARAAPDDFSYRGQCLIGLPSVSALEEMLRLYDYKVEKSFDWPALLAAHPGAVQVGSYASGRRVTIRAVDAPQPRDAPAARKAARQSARGQAAKQPSAVRRVARAAGIKRPKALRRR